MKVFKSLDGDMIKNSFKDMFVILNALKYLYFKEFFSTFLLLYFFSTHVKEHVDNLIASSDYFTRLLNENVWMNIQNFQPYTTLVGLLHVTWLRHNCWLEIPVLGRNHTRAAFWIMMNACKGRSMSLSLTYIRTYRTEYIKDQTFVSGIWTLELSSAWTRLLHHFPLPAPQTTSGQLI